VYFSVREPTGSEIPVVVEIPHAGVRVDPETLATLIAPARAIGLDADLYVDDLYTRAPELGATVLVAHASRYVCDLNRSEQDVDRDTVLGATGRASPHGLIWRSTTDNRAPDLPDARVKLAESAAQRPEEDGGIVAAISRRNRLRDAL